MGTARCFRGEAYMKGQNIKIHRLVIGAKPGEIVDHINGNKLDNRRSNLRIATHAQNMANRVKSHNNTSGFKGVTFDTSMSRRKRWGASINHAGRRIKIGRYLTPEEAAKAYDNVALKLKGQYALLNFRRIES
jgi:hypothetical protein